MNVNKDVPGTLVVIIIKSFKIRNNWFKIFHI